MTFLQSWILFPVVVVVLSTGAGLLVERVARPALPGALVAPVGFALLMVVSALFTARDALAPPEVRAQVFTIGAGLKITAAATGTAAVGLLAGAPIPLQFLVVGLNPVVTGLISC